MPEHKLLPQFLLIINQHRSAITRKLHKQADNQTISRIKPTETDLYITMAQHFVRCWYAT